MKRRYTSIFGLVFANILLISFSVIGQPILEWENKFDFENGTDKPFKLLIDDQGNSYIAGNSYNSSTDDNIIYYKLNNIGSQEWVQNISNLSEDHIADFIKDSNNNLYLTGYYGNISLPEQGFIQKSNADGQVQWVDTFLSSGQSLMTDESNNLYLLYNNLNVTIVKYNTEGEILFQVRNDTFSLGYTVIPLVISHDGANNIYAAGYSLTNGNTEYFLKKFSNSGSFLWDVRYNPSTFNDYPHFMALDDSANIYILGDIHGGTNGGSGIALVKFDSSGNMQWENQILSDPSYPFGLDIVKNEVIICGYLKDTKITHFVKKYSDSGEEIWNYNPDDSLNSGVIKSGALATDKEGDVYYTGSIKGNGFGNLSDILLLHLDSNGILVWRTEYNSTPNNSDVPINIKINNEIKIEIAGFTIDSITGYDFLTLKYAQSTGISIINSLTPCNIFPNPFHTIATIAIPQSISSAKILKLLWYDLPGRIIKSEEIAEQKNYTINRAGIANGMYVLKLVSDNQVIATAKIVVQ